MESTDAAADGREPDNDSNPKQLRRLGLSPARFVAVGYLAYSVVGWVLLCLPWSGAPEASALDHLFTAVSAVSTTGLATHATSAYSLFGQFVILSLIQLGALGYMTVSSFIVLSRSNHLPVWNEAVTRTNFGIPHQFAVRDFLRAVVVFTLVVEAIGAIALYPSFAAAGTERPLWDAIFHSVSAFGTAGFSTQPNGTMLFADSYAGSLTLAVLSYAGAVGFIVWVDLWYQIRRRSHALTLTSRVILRATAVIAIVGTVLLAATEPTLADEPAHERVLLAFFQTMTATTTVGFNTMDIGALSASSLVFLCTLMVFGASPSGTGGGLKITTFTALFATVRSTLRRRPRITFMGCAIPQARLDAAHAAFSYFFIVLFVAVFLLTLTSDLPAFDLGFEALSALGTVGISTGVTGQLPPFAAFVVVVLMYMGRVGILAFGLATTFSDDDAPTDDDLIL